MRRQVGTEARPTNRLILSEEAASNQGAVFLWVSPGDKI